MCTTEFLLKSTICGITGTTLMTGFDYCCSRLFSSKGYVIPLLGSMLTNSTGRKDAHSSLQVWVTGTTAHFLIGILFAAVYILLWNTGAGRANLVTGITWGFLTGLFGITVWRIYFLFHPDPPPVSLTLHLAGILAGHVFFGAGVALSYRFYVTYLENSGC